MKIICYTKQDFDFAIAYIDDLNVFYIIPVEIFVSYKSTLTFVESIKRQRKLKSSEYRENWDLLFKWAT